MNKLREIFKDHFQKMLDAGVEFRDTVIENVEKFLNCGNLGYATFICENCNKFHHINFRCKSRFCTTCGNRYNIERAEVMAHKVLDCPHRHCVFTIPDSLRFYFRRDWELLNVLFDAVRDCVYNQFPKAQTPAFICILHTFGRDLKWNPHVHMLLAEGGAVGSKWLEKQYFNYESLRKSFQTILLKKLYAKLGREIKPLIGQIYKTAANGFYVNAPKTKGKIRNLINYIGRYLGRPVIAKSRIVDYDGQTVTFHYKRHEDNRMIIEKIPAGEFIKRLVIHIPPKYFNMIRFFGVYALETALSEKIGKAIKQKRASLRFRELLLKTLGVDPHKCAKCGSTLVFGWLTHTAKNEIRLRRSHSPPKGVPSQTPA